MFSDTHFHLAHLAERGQNIASLFTALAERGTAFALDIGNKPNDIDTRLSVMRHALDSIDSDKIKSQVKNFLFFAMGIWPSRDAIVDRERAVKMLQDDFLRAKSTDELSTKIAALGECGVDHHWNPSGADNRSQDGFTAKIITGEVELFEAQLSLARSLDLPVIVHSRDAFDSTLSCIANVGYDRGVIHCFSYDIPQARAFLERGWYISFSGSITYVKKQAIDAMQSLLKFVPRDRFLLETDSPFLAPVPERGNINTPILIEHIYAFASELLGTSAEELSALVDANVRNLFFA
jgi:TatD DNase family protein